MTIPAETASIDFAKAVADETQLRSALEAADVAPLAMVLAHLTGDDAILEELRPHIQGPWNFMESVPLELKQKVREKLIVALQTYATTGHAPPGVPSRDLVRTIMSVCVGQPVPDEYIPMMLEEMRMDQEDPRTVSWRQQPDPNDLEAFKVLIIGAGMSPCPRI